VEAIFLPASPAFEQKLRSGGYEPARDGAGWINPHGMFPRIVPQMGCGTAVHLKVGSVTDFADVWRIQQRIEGEPLSPYRRVRASVEGDAEHCAAEPCGHVGFAIPPSSATRAMDTLTTPASFLTRPS